MRWSWSLLWRWFGRGFWEGKRNFGSVGGSEMSTEISVVPGFAAKTAGSAMTALTLEQDIGLLDCSRFRQLVGDYI